MNKITVINAYPKNVIVNMIKKGNAQDKGKLQFEIKIATENK